MTVLKNLLKSRYMTQSRHSLTYTIALPTAAMHPYSGLNIKAVIKEELFVLQTQHKRYGLLYKPIESNEYDYKDVYHPSPLSPFALEMYTRLLVSKCKFRFHRF